MSRGLVARLEWLEVDGTLAPDCRRVLQGERFAILAAQRAGDDDAIAAAETEARRVMAMWGVSDTTRPEDARREVADAINARAKAGAR